MARQRRLVFVFACAMALVSGCGESQDRRSGAKGAESNEHARVSKEERTRLVADLSRQHNADITWSGAPLVWTADVQERLMRADNRPIVGIAKFVDIERDGTGYLLRLRHYSGVLDTPVDLILKTQRPERPKKDRSRYVGEDGAADYAFVARIQRVRRHDIFTSDGNRRRWIAEGECVELREVPVASAQATTPAKPTYQIPNPFPPKSQ
jgi:hypothetical protein